MTIDWDDVYAEQDINDATSSLMDKITKVLDTLCQLHGSEGEGCQALVVWKQIQGAALDDWRGESSSSEAQKPKGVL